MPSPLRRTLWLAGLAVAVVAGGASLTQRVARTRARVVAAPAGQDADIARQDSLARARQDSVNRAQPGYVVDSILPIDEEIRRFRAVAGPSVSDFEGGARSADALVKAFATALSQADSSTLKELTVSIREFAYLIYPSSPYMKEPYRQPPGLLWRTIAAPNEAGRIRLLRRMGSRPLPIAGLLCPDSSERQGQNTLHLNCLVELKQPDGAVVRRRLFGTIVERNGRFKFMSLQNDI